MASIGPVEYVVIAFPGNRFKGEIVPALAELVDNDVIRIIDVAFIKKDADGNTTMFEYDTLDDVLAFGFADVDGEAGGVLNDEDLELAEETPFGLGFWLTGYDDAWDDGSGHGPVGRISAVYNY